MNVSERDRSKPCSSSSSEVEAAAVVVDALHETNGGLSRSLSEWFSSDGDVDIWKARVGEDTDEISVLPESWGAFTADLNPMEKDSTGIAQESASTGGLASNANVVRTEKDQKVEKKRRAGGETCAGSVSFQARYLLWHKLCLPSRRRKMLHGLETRKILREAEVMRLLFIHSIHHDV